MISVIKNQNGITLGEIATVKKGFEPGAEAYQEEGKLFIRVSSISKDGITDKDQKYLKNELYEKLKKDYQPKIGEILLTKDASPGMAYVVKEPIEVEGLISGGVLRIKPKENIEPEYLALVINSIVGQLQVERDAGGSIIVHWKPDQVKEMQIPILPKLVQQKIAELVQKSHEARKKAKELLEEAKHKVEELIGK
jgi:restriction endonuclease S subunit